MVPGLEVAEVVRRYGAAYRQALAGHFGRVERRVMGTIEAPAGRRHLAAMSSVARTAGWSTSPITRAATGIARSARGWLAPVAGGTALCHRIPGGRQTLCTIAADPRHLGAEIGVVAVLHTWGHNLHHHPHVHCMVPGGGLSLDGTRWIACRLGFFLLVRVLSRLFRRLFLDHWHPRLLRRPREFGRPGRLRAASRWVASARMGRLRQAALW